jgi:hypothetical protein
VVIYVSNIIPISTSVAIIISRFKCLSLFLLVMMWFPLTGATPKTNDLGHKNKN